MVPEASSTPIAANGRRRYVSRSLTMDLNQQITTHFSSTTNVTSTVTSRRSSSSNSTSSFTTQTKLSTLSAALKVISHCSRLSRQRFVNQFVSVAQDGTLSPTAVTPDACKSVVGFPFGRAPMPPSRQTSFNGSGGSTSIKRSRPTHPVYNRSRTTDLTDLARRTSALVSSSLR